MADQPRPSVSSNGHTDSSVRLERVRDVSRLIGVEWGFGCSHRDPVRTEIHGHSYLVTCWFDAEPPRDAVILQEKLKVALLAFDHKTLPDELSRAEDIGAAIMHLMGCEGVELYRSVERLRVKVGRCG